MANFFSGVIEGFYGPPWSDDDRRTLFHRLHDLGLNTYVYAPKDDLKHRALWREPYDLAESARLETLARDAHALGLRFIYALSPGLDFRYGDATDTRLLRQRFTQLLELGIRHFALDRKSVV